MILEPLLIFLVAITVLLLICPKFFGRVLGKIGVNKRNISILGAVTIFLLVIFGYYQTVKVRMSTVDSSAIDQIGYNDENKLLKIQFKNGDVYQYYDVPRGVYEEFKDSQSKGHYFQNGIRNSGYKYEKISDSTSLHLEQ